MYLLMLYPCINFKAIEQMVMEILHFKDLGDTESVAMNAVVLVLAECQILMVMYLTGYLLYCNVLGIDHVMSL